MFYGYCVPTHDVDKWPTGLVFGFTVDCPNLTAPIGAEWPLRYLVPAKRGDEVVAYAIQNDDDRREGVFFTFYPGLFHRDIVQVRDFTMKNACDREVIPLAVGGVVVAA